MRKKIEPLPPLANAMDDFISKSFGIPSRYLRERQRDYSEEVDEARRVFEIMIQRLRSMKHKHKYVLMCGIRQTVWLADGVTPIDPDTGEAFGIGDS